uniref:OTU domain-containing protein n=1 Tax=Auxenochlorella protothecoides TaxID=3075 RepID=A0A1D1ZP57_AUXPR
MSSYHTVIGMVKPKVIPGDVDTLAQYSPEGCLEREARITAALETLAHPLIVFDRDAAVNVGFSQADCQAGGPVMRLRQPSDGQADYGWEDCRVIPPNRKDTWLPARLRLLCQGSVSSRECLRDRLASVELRACFTSCQAPSQFEAMSWALYKTRKFASNLRKLSLETMAAHPDMYARFLGADFPAYLAHMSLPATAGDELTLRAIGHHFGIHICVATGEESQWLLRFPPPITLSRRQLVLAWCQGSWAPIRGQTVFEDFKQAMLLSIRQQPIHLI